MLFLTILEVLNFDFSKFEQLSSPKFTKIQSPESLKLPKMTFLERLNSPKLDFTQNWSGGKIIKFQQSQALTSHFESFWSMVKQIHDCFHKKFLIVGFPSQSVYVRRGRTSAHFQRHFHNAHHHTENTVREVNVNKAGR